VPYALLSDIHGNMQAFDAVLRELARFGVDDGVVLGDVAQGGDEPAAVLDRLAELGWPVILGNADDFVLGADSPEEITPEQVAKREWTRSQLDETHRDQIRAFPRTLELGRLLAFHGSPHSYDDVLLPETDDDAAWNVPGFDVLAGGHTHIQWTRVVGDALYVNPGAVMSDPPEFAVLTGRSVQFFRCR
jgi:predicted phosphodiesterase